MAVYQINVWVCEVCGKTETTSQRTGPYSDPLVEYPNGIEWPDVSVDGKEKLACPECGKKHSCFDEDLAKLNPK